MEQLCINNKQEEIRNEVSPTHDHKNAAMTSGYKLTRALSDSGTDSSPSWKVPWSWLLEDIKFLWFQTFMELQIKSILWLLPWRRRRGDELEKGEWREQTSWCTSHFATIKILCRYLQTLNTRYLAATCSRSSLWPSTIFIVLSISQCKTCILIFDDPNI